MKSATLILCLGFCMTADIAISQENKIETDRPGESQSTALTAKGYFQAETGFRKEQYNETDDAVIFPQMQLKYGLSRRVELRAELTGESDRLASENKFEHGLMPVELGFKTKLLEQKGAIPATSFYMQVGIPTWASEDHRKDHALPKVRLLFENKLTDKLTLTYNAGAEWKEDAESPQWLYTIQPQLALNDKWELFAETFAYLQTGQALQQSIDGGFAFYPTKNIKLDLGAGKGLSKEAHDYFIAGGISFRLLP